MVGRAGVVWQAPAVALFPLFSQPGGEFLFVVILLGSDPALWGVEARFRNKNAGLAACKKQRNESNKKEKIRYV